MGFIYLGSPYSGTEAEQEERYKKARWTTAEFLKLGTVVYSPIVHCHDLAKHHNLPGDAAFWHWYNLAMLRVAHTLFVLTLPGWRESKGLTWEREQAEKLNKLIRRVDIVEGKLNVGPADFS